MTALLRRPDGAFTSPLRDALAGTPQIVERLDEIQSAAELPVPLSALRVLDIVVWMAVHGDRQVRG